MPAHATLTHLSTAALRLALLFALPFTLLVLVLLRLSASLPSRRRRQRQPATSGRQTILLTTNSARSNTCALSLARALHARGHYAVAVAHALPDPPSRRFPLSLLLNPSSLLPPATSFSAAVASAHRLHIPAAPLRVRHADPDDDSASSLYEHEVLGVILRLRPSVWVPCELLVDGGGGGDAALREAVGLLRETLGREAERGRPRVRCGVLAPEGAVAGFMQGDEAFGRLVEELGCAAEAVEPRGEDVVVRRRGEVHGMLHAGRKQGKKWVLEARESDVAGEVQRVELPVGDGDSLNDTYECLARLDVSDARPWVMREAVEVEAEGGEAYRAHAVVLNGAVRAFAASRAADAADETAGRLFLEPSSPLHVSIHAFVDAFVAALPGHPPAPLAIDITVRTSPTPTGTATSIHPTRCSWTLPPLSAPPFSTAIASLVSSIASSSSLPPPPPPPGQKRPTSTDEAVSAQNGRLPPPPPPDLHTPPTSPVLNPLVTRFVASTLPPTPPGSPDSRRSRSADTSPPRQHHHSKKREFAPLPLPQTPSTPPPPAPLGWSSRPGSSGSSIGGGGDGGSSSSSTHLELSVAVAPKQKLADVPTSTPPPPAKRRAADDAVTDKVSSSSADLVYGVAGTYSLPRTLRAYVLLPLLELLLLRRPVRRGVVAVVQGWAVVVERVLLPGQGAWVEEGGGWWWWWGDRWDLAPWVWEWGVRWAVGV
ncbi:hypothetical protein SLS55_006039 [Diplodia seriata]|uniref:BTB domain-containing protein n=1 Tax=Diplodia seriata TaxID=420778 RepID=A0ABR3CD36_9PEZI